MYKIKRIFSARPIVYFIKSRSPSRSKQRFCLSLLVWDLTENVRQRYFASNKKKNSVYILTVICQKRSINDCAPNFYGPIVRFSLRHCPPHQQYHLKKKTPSNQNIVKKNRNKITTNITLSVMSASNNFLRIPKVWFFN